jgi:phospholipase C
MNGDDSTGSGRQDPNDARDPAAAERLEAVDPDGFMRRREFLQRAAITGGLAMSMASVLSPDVILGEAAARDRVDVPDAKNLPLDTIVVLMMENRSFDHYFGWFPGADGNNQLQYPDENGDLHSTHPLAPDFQGCAFKDPDHGWEGGREEFNNGALDGFLTTNDEYAIGYYLKDDLPFIPHAAEAFTLYDRYFCSILGPTYVNRHYQWSAQSGGSKTNVLPPPDLGWKFENIFDRAQALGVSVRYYNSDLPFAALYGSRSLPWIRPVAEFYADAAAGTLPNICFVDPPFRDGGGGDGLSGDEHPAGDIRIGQAFMSDIVHAFMGQPTEKWARSAMFVNYDEWGGFFDHVAPPKVPDDRESSDLAEDFGQTGFRTPTVAISPYARRGSVDHGTYTHESILKLISYRFGLGYLNKRHRYASNIGYSFDWENPDTDVPDLPDPDAPFPFGTTQPPAIACALQTGPLAADTPTGRPADAEPSDEGVELNSQEMVDYVEAVGFDYKPWKPSDVFSEPDSVTKALRGEG